jgi:hypothetical protein
MGTRLASELMLRIVPPPGPNCSTVARMASTDPSTLMLNWR